ncbi:rod-binding protein [Sphingomonas flavalba]|uniref:rod-binding protein n=1 Tax=Sphingomonas flavalba TaxID=2559804 RepID=UPI00109DA515|nr:rod-binding protein [Sphingomonas flavalba]
MTAPVSGVGGAAPDSSRLATADNLKAAGEKFESLFIGMMLKSMRQAKLADGLFENDAQNQFRDMQDTKLSEAMAVHTPMGIGKAMTEFLARSQPALADPGQPPPQGSKE